jgi:hypothetical protein
MVRENVTCVAVHAVTVPVIVFEPWVNVTVGLGSVLIKFVPGIVIPVYVLPRVPVMRESAPEIVGSA